MGNPPPQARCCRIRSEWQVDVEILEQVVPVLVLLLLVLLDVGDVASHFCLPLRMLMQSVVYVLLRFFNGGQPGVEAGMIHLLIVVATGREIHTSSLVAT